MTADARGGGPGVSLTFNTAGPTDVPGQKFRIQVDASKIKNRSQVGGSISVFDGDPSLNTKWELELASIQHVGSLMSYNIFSPSLIRNGSHLPSSEIEISRLKLLFGGVADKNTHIAADGVGIEASRMCTMRIYMVNASVATGGAQIKRSLHTYDNGDVDLRINPSGLGAFTKASFVVSKHVGQQIFLDAQANYLGMHGRGTVEGEAQPTSFGTVQGNVKVGSHIAF